MNIFEKARELGNLILETKEGKKLNDKRYIFDANEDAKRKLFEYSRYRDSIQIKINNGELSGEELKSEQENLKKKASEVMEDPIIREMFAAEEELSAIVNQVINILTATVEGNADGGCSGNCSVCSGCH